jgi:hypothetical protein
MFVNVDDLRQGSNRIALARIDALVSARLAAGMYPSVKWPVQGNQRVLLVPVTSVITTTERVFVIRVKDGTAEWVDVKRGPTHGDLAEVVSPLVAKDLVLRRGTDEIRQGTRINARVAPPGREQK